MIHLLVHSTQDNPALVVDRLYNTRQIEQGYYSVSCKTEDILHVLYDLNAHKIEEIADFTNTEDAKEKIKLHKYATSVQFGCELCYTNYATRLIGHYNETKEVYDSMLVCERCSSVIVDHWQYVYITDTRFIVEQNTCQALVVWKGGV